MRATLRSVIPALIMSIVLFTCQNSPALAGASATVIAVNLRQVEIILPGTDAPQKMIYEIVSGYALMEGDIILGRVDARGNLLKNDFTS